MLCQADDMAAIIMAVILLCMQHVQLLLVFNALQPVSGKSVVRHSSHVLLLAVADGPATLPHAMYMASACTWLPALVYIITVSVAQGLSLPQSTPVSHSLFSGPNISTVTGHSLPMDLPGSMAQDPLMEVQNGWMVVPDPNGRRFYHNRFTQESIWESALCY